MPGSWYANSTMPALEDVDHLLGPLDKDDTLRSSYKEKFEKWHAEDMNHMVFLKDDYKATNDWDAQVNAAALDLDIVRLLTETTDRLKAARNAITRTKWHRHLEMMAGQLGDYNDAEGVHISNLIGFQSIALGFFNKDNPLHKRALLALSIMQGQVVKGGFLWADQNNHNGNLRCMTHVYKKKGIKIICFFQVHHQRRELGQVSTTGCSGERETFF